MTTSREVENPRDRKAGFREAAAADIPKEKP
jgi:hypothetical protein